MEHETGKHWSKLLKSAAIAMNSTKKRSHGKTAFKVMWGRESRHQDLLSAINDMATNPEAYFEIEEAIIAEVMPSQDGIESDVFSALELQDEDEVTIIEDARKATHQSAADCITFEQMKQKIHYDKKVNDNR